MHVFDPCNLSSISRFKLLLAIPTSPIRSCAHPQDRLGLKRASQVCAEFPRNARTVPRSFPLLWPHEVNSVVRTIESKAIEICFSCRVTVFSSKSCFEVDLWWRVIVQKQLVRPPPLDLNWKPFLDLCCFSLSEVPLCQCVAVLGSSFNLEELIPFVQVSKNLLGCQNFHWSSDQILVDHCFACWCGRMMEEKLANRLQGAWVLYAFRTERFSNKNDRNVDSPWPLVSLLVALGDGSSGFTQPSYHGCVVVFATHGAWTMNVRTLWEIKCSRTRFREPLRIFCSETSFVCQDNIVTFFCDFPDVTAATEEVVQEVDRTVNDLEQKLYQVGAFLELENEMFFGLVQLLVHKPLPRSVVWHARLARKTFTWCQLFCLAMLLSRHKILSRVWISIAPATSCSSTKMKWKPTEHTGKAPTPDVFCGMVHHERQHCSAFETKTVVAQQRGSVSHCRWYGGIAIGCMFLLIVVFYYFGLGFGCAGEPPYEDGASTCNRGVGANLFMACVSVLPYWSTLHQHCLHVTRRAWPCGGHNPTQIDTKYDSTGKFDRISLQFQRRGFHVSILLAADGNSHRLLHHRSTDVFRSLQKLGWNRELPSDRGLSQVVVSWSDQVVTCCCDVWQDSSMSGRAWRFLCSLWTKFCKSSWTNMLTLTTKWTLRLFSSKLRGDSLRLSSSVCSEQDLLEETCAVCWHFIRAVVISRGCKENGPLYQVFSLDKIVNLTEVLDLEARKFLMLFLNFGDVYQHPGCDFWACGSPKCKWCNRDGGVLFVVSMWTLGLPGGTAEIAIGFYCFAQSNENGCFTRHPGDKTNGWFWNWDRKLLDLIVVFCRRQSNETWSLSPPAQLRNSQFVAGRQQRPVCYNSPFSDHNAHCKISFSELSEMIRCSVVSIFENVNRL